MPASTPSKSVHETGGLVMRVPRRLTFRRARSKRSAVALLIAMLMTPAGRPLFVPTLSAQQQVGPVSQGFVISPDDLRFIYDQILVGQAHAGGGQLLGPGPNQVNDPQLPRGLRTVDGSFNNLVPGQTAFGAADRLFPRLTTPVYRAAEQGTNYAQKSLNNVVFDSQPRIISNLVVDQSSANPAAVAAADNPCGSGGFVCSGTSVPDATTGTVFIPNITPDFGLSAPFNLMFAFFGQFFDHGLDLVTKGGGSVIMPLRADDPLIVGRDGIAGTADDPPNPPPADQRFMAMTRGQNQPGPDGILGDDPKTPNIDEGADDIQEGMNTTTPWVDQNQTYTSHPSHQVFLREYEMAAGKPVPNGKVLDGGFCAPRPTGYPDDKICDIGNWAEVKAQASSLLGIHLVDQDVLNVPFIMTDLYGHFTPGAHGFPQMVGPGGVPVEGDPTVINDD